MLIIDIRPNQDVQSVSSDVHSALSPVQRPSLGHILWADGRQHGQHEPLAVSQTDSPVIRDGGETAAQGTCHQRPWCPCQTHLRPSFRLGHPQDQPGTNDPWETTFIYWGVGYLWVCQLEFIYMYICMQWLKLTLAKHQMQVKIGNGKKMRQCYSPVGQSLLNINSKNAWERDMVWRKYQIAKAELKWYKNVIWFAAMWSLHMSHSW